MVSTSASALPGHNICITPSRCRCSRPTHLLRFRGSSPKSAMFTNTWFDVVTINFAMIHLDGSSSEQSPRYRWIDEHHGSKWSFPTNGCVLPSAMLGALCTSCLPRAPGTCNLMNDVITCSPIPRKYYFSSTRLAFAIISCFATTFLTSLSQHCRRRG